MGPGRDWGCLEVLPAMDLVPMEVAPQARHQVLHDYVEVVRAIHLVPMEVAPKARHELPQGYVEVVPFVDSGAHGAGPMGITKIDRFIYYIISAT